MSSVFASTSRARPALALARQLNCSRGYADQLTVKHKTGLPILQSGATGRHGVTGHVATVFGCTGFLGRYVVQKMARRGTQVVVPFRHADDARFLKPMGDLGRIVHLEWDLRSDAMIEETLRHSDVVINAVGRDWETGNFSFQDIYAEGPRRMARLAQRAGVSRFIHVSHIDADHHSPSASLRAKAQGEDAVMDAFPGATIVRPSYMFGAEDQLLNLLGFYPWLFRVNGQRTRTSPVHVLDVAEAITTLVDAESTVGKIVTLPGPHSMTYADIIRIGEAAAHRKFDGVNVPRFALSAASHFAKYITRVNPDFVARRYIDEKPVAVGSLSWDYLDIEPDTLEDLAAVYMRMYRPIDKMDSLINQGGVHLLKRKRYNVVR